MHSSFVNFLLILEFHLENFFHKQKKFTSFLNNSKIKAKIFKFYIPDQIFLVNHDRFLLFSLQTPFLINFY